MLRALLAVSAWLENHLPVRVVAFAYRLHIPSHGQKWWTLRGWLDPKEN